VVGTKLTWPYLTPRSTITVFENSLTAEGLPTQDGDFETIFVVEMDMHRRDVEVMAIMMRVCPIAATRHGYGG
jgi:hypothetical protein